MHMWYKAQCSSKTHFYWCSSLEFQGVYYTRISVTEVAPKGYTPVVGKLHDILEAFFQLTNTIPED